MSTSGGRSATQKTGLRCWREGSSDANRHLLNIQPVIPTKLNPNWNLIIRMSCQNTSDIFATLRRKREFSAM